MILRFFFFYINSSNFVGKYFIDIPSRTLAGFLGIFVFVLRKLIGPLLYFGYLDYCQTKVQSSSLKSYLTKNKISSLGDLHCVD